MHTLRQVVNNDEKWRSILVGMNKTFYHQTVNSIQIENYLSVQTDIDLQPFFNQYLRTIKVPILEYRLTDFEMQYRYQNTVDDFEMRLKTFIGDDSLWISPKTEWQSIEVQGQVAFDPNFYIDYQEIK